MAISGENSKFTLIRCADDAAWHAARNLGIGGSDVAAILGLSKWSSPSEIYLDKIGQGLPDDDAKKDLFAFGNIMEPYVRDRFAQEHPEIRVRRVNAICQAKDRPWAQASLDYECREDGEWGVLEIKTARSQSSWDAGVPPYYLTQVMHYLAVTGRSFAWVACLFRDSCRVKSFRVERDDAYISAIESAVDRFWNENVLKRVPPTTVVATENESKALVAIWGAPKSKGATAYATDPQTAQAIAEYRQAVADEKLAKERKSQLSNWLISRVGDNAALISGKTRVTWIRSMRESFDRKALKRDHPDVYQQYSTQKLTSGGIRISEVK